MAFTVIKMKVQVFGSNAPVEIPTLFYEDENGNMIESVCPFQNKIITKQVSFEGPNRLAPEKGIQNQAQSFPCYGLCPFFEYRNSFGNGAAKQLVLHCSTEAQLIPLKQNPTP